MISRSLHFEGGSGGGRGILVWSLGEPALVEEGVEFANEGSLLGMVGSGLSIEEEEELRVFLHALLNILI